jgi:uncharacterized phage-associated protein
MALVLVAVAVQKNVRGLHYAGKPVDHEGLDQLAFGCGQVTDSLVILGFRRRCAPMAEIRDVAEYILRKQGSMTAMKLQKLVYYSQAWHLVWEEKPLFENEIQAWANGPVAPRLYAYHRGRFSVSPTEIKAEEPLLAADEVTSIDGVLGFYGQYSAMELSNLTHAERPWADARGDLPVGARCETPITQAAMAEYYGSLV